ncbi:MAG: SsrA-binding protein SmpB [Phycisphaerales bacterium]|nr:MAG: SsrA-binding protein SmpB [Phycisphaerales bacterium]
MSKKPSLNAAVCRNRKASFRFELLERLECGLVLRGAEVKSLREGRASLEEAYIRIEDDGLWLIGCHIAPYTFDTCGRYDALRRRKLLVHARELRKLAPKVAQKGLTLVPLRLYFNSRGIAKVEIALARGKRLTDKRQTLKEREHKREMDRAQRDSR